MAQMSTPNAERVSSRALKMEMAIGTVVALVAVAAIVVARGFPSTGLSTDIGSARFPTVYACLLIILCGMLIVGNAVRLHRAKILQNIRSSESEEASGQRHWAAVVAIFATLVSFIAMSYVGYLGSTIVYLCFLMWLMGFKHKLLNPVIAMTITGMLYFSFAYLLNVPLPIGSLFE